MIELVAVRMYDPPGPADIPRQHPNRSPNLRRRVLSPYLPQSSQLQLNSFLHLTRKSCTYRPTYCTPGATGIWPTPSPIESAAPSAHPTASVRGGNFQSRSPHSAEWDRHLSAAPRGRVWKLLSIVVVPNSSADALTVACRGVGAPTRREMSAVPHPVYGLFSSRS